MKRRIFIVIVALGTLVAIGLPLSGVLNAVTPVSITTERYNLSRNAVNTSETILNVANVKSLSHSGTANNFGRLFSDAVDGDIYTQPLLMNGISIPGKGVHNVVYVATMHNTVYAFDADKAGPPLWSKNLGVPWTGDCRACDSNDYPDISTNDIPGGEDGVLSTPVIDPTTKTMYLVSHHDGVHSDPLKPPTHVLHALDISSGAEKFGGPVVIAAQVSGAFGATNVGGVISYDAGQHLQRASLALSNGRVILGMGSTADIYPFYGWLFAYSANNLKSAPAVWLTSPQGFGSGIWMAGSAPTIDSSGYIYVTTGNGDFLPNPADATHSPLGDYGDSVVKLKLDTAHNVFNIVDYFTPWNQEALDQGDIDLGTSNFMLVPGTHYLFGGGKHNSVYLLDTTDMGQYVCAPPYSDPCPNRDSDVVSNLDRQIVQEWNGKNSHLHNTPNLWIPPTSYCTNCQLAYLFSEQDMLKAYKFVPGPNGTGSFPGNPPVPVSTNGQIQNFGMPSGMMSVSSNGTTAGTGILWVMDYKSNFRAVDATDVSKILWADKDLARDGIGVASKFVIPVVANGKVYVGTRQGRLLVYGLLPTPALDGVLTGTITNAPPANINLTTEGTLDWAQWGLINNTSFNHKMGATGPVGMIGPIVPHGTGPLQYTGGATNFTWTDGTPTTAQNSTNTGVYVAAGSGYQEVPSIQFTVPADTTPRVLKVYVALTNAQGGFRASLSDGSAPDFTESTYDDLIGNDYRVYTLNYQAASANQLLYVTWSMLQDNGSGKARIQAVSLTTYLAPDVPPQPSFQPPTNTPFAATSTITPTPGPSPMPTRTPTPLPPDSFRVKYAALNIRDTELQIRAAVNVVNLTTTSANMTEFKLRYYFTKNGGGTLAFTCETAVITCAKVHGAFVAINPAVAGADTYLEMSFDSQTLPQSGGSSGVIQFHIAKSDNSTFNQTDDFSYDSSLTTLTDSRRIAMYRNNTLIWGSLPSLVAPVLTSPADGATGLTSHPTLQWTGNDSASRYQVKVVSGNSTVFLLWYSASSVCAGTACNVSPNVTLPNGLYTWFVETGTPAQNGPWSISRTFKVGP